jgi:hypothetical protein
MMLVEDIETRLKEQIEAAFADPSSGEVDANALSTAVQATTERTQDMHPPFKRAVCKYLSCTEQKPSG